MSFSRPVLGGTLTLLSLSLAHAVPEDYEEMLAYYTKHGFRVIALAGKSMPGLTWIKAQRLKRFVSFADAVV